MEAKVDKILYIDTENATGPHVKSKNKNKNKCVKNVACVFKFMVYAIGIVPITFIAHYYYYGFLVCALRVLVFHVSWLWTFATFSIYYFK